MRRNKVILDLSLLLLVAVLFIFPHVMGQGMILGSDSIFHFNRFYDTAMQVEEANFQYFISLYGFQASARMVNVFYGPLTAYFHGLLVLLSNSWFHYQVIANFVLFLLSGYSMYFFLWRGGVASPWRVTFSMLYVTTFSIHYWTTRQGFSSWGAALLPLCLLPIVDWVNQKETHPLQLGVLVAILFQTHLFSSLLLVVIYLPYFTYALIKAADRRKMMRDLFLAIVIFFLLTLNVWVSFLEIFNHNTILSPFVNQNMSSNTINRNSSYWLFNPAVLFLMLVVEVGVGLKWWQHRSILHRITWGLMIFFLFLSTSLIPWNDLVDKGIPLAELVQFPFRFFVPCTVLLLFSFCMTLQAYFRRPTPIVRRVLTVSVGASLFQVLILISLSIYQWHHSETFIRSGTHTSLHAADMEELKASFFDSDLSIALQLIQKATPDYLPLYEAEGHSTEENKYEAYKNQIIDRNEAFSKRVSDNTLIVEWSAPSSGPTEVPVVSYHQTELRLNGQELSNQEVQVSNIGSPRVLSRKGENRLEVSYAPMPGFTVILSLTFVAWSICLGVGLRRLHIARGEYLSGK